MSYSAVRGLGDGTSDPPPSAYCQTYIAQIESCRNAQQGAALAATSLQAQLEAANRSWDSRLSSCQASAAGVAAGMSQGMATKDAQIKGLQSELDAARAKVCPKPKSCLFWIIVAAVGTGAAIVQTARGSKNKGRQPEKLPGRTSSKKEG